MLVILAKAGEAFNASLVFVAKEVAVPDHVVRAKVSKSKRKLARSQKKSFKRSKRSRRAQALISFDGPRLGVRFDDVKGGVSISKGSNKDECIFDGWFVVALNGESLKSLGITSKKALIKKIKEAERPLTLTQVL